MRCYNLTFSVHLRVPKVRKLAAGTTWADVASEFTIKAVVLKVESSAGNGNSGVQVYCISFFEMFSNFVLDFPINTSNNYTPLVW